jgi:hypothetical protein|tara:strand:+ start:852 stop:956 length:105 start_codon:yes stop_codon:yes gene_type:complete
MITEEKGKTQSKKEFHSGAMEIVGITTEELSTYK